MRGLSDKRLMFVRLRKEEFWGKGRRAQAEAGNEGGAGKSRKHQHPPILTVLSEQEGSKSRNAPVWSDESRQAQRESSE